MSDDELLRLPLTSFVAEATNGRTHVGVLCLENKRFGGELESMRDMPAAQLRQLTLALAADASLQIAIRPIFSRSQTQTETVPASVLKAVAEQGDLRCGVPLLFDSRKIDSYAVLVFTDVEQALATAGIRAATRSVIRRTPDATAWLVRRSFVLPEAALFARYYLPGYQQRHVDACVSGTRASRLSLCAMQVQYPSGNKIGSLLRAFACSTELQQAGAHHRQLDCDLSLLGQMLVRYAIEADTLLLVHGGVRELLVAQLAAYSAYSQCGGLLLHVLLTGAHATSKSFTLKLVTELMVADTVEVVTRSTAASGDIDGDELDRVRVHHELQPSLLVANSTAADIVKLKAALTEGVSTTLVFEGRGGARTQRTVRSEKRIALLAATNEPVERIDKALLSRFVRLERSAATAAGERGDVAASALLLAQLSSDKQQARNAAVQHAHFVQYAVYRIEQAIAAGVLHEVTLAALPCVLRAYEATLRQCYLVPMEKRHVEQVRAAVRSLVVWRAAYMAVQCALRDAVPALSEWYVLPADPWLKDDLELCLVAFDLLAEQWLDRTQLAVVMALRRYAPPLPPLAPGGGEYVAVHAFASAAALASEVQKLTRATAPVASAAVALAAEQRSVLVAVAGDLALRPALRITGDRVEAHRALLVPPRAAETIEEFVAQAHQHAIESCYSRYTLPHKLICGRTIAHAPHLLAVRTAGAAPRSAHVQRPGEHVSAAEAAALALTPAGAIVEELGESHDDYATRMRLAALRWPVTPATVAQYSPRNCSPTLAAAVQPLEYPDAFVDEYEHEVKRARRTLVANDD